MIIPIEFYRKSDNPTKLTKGPPLPPEGTHLVE
jgi:hypothetical protein